MMRIGVTKRPRRCITKSKRGDTLKVHYNGTLYKNDDVIDCSIEREEPFLFTLGAGEVMEGWERGLHRMCVGEERKLVIPSGMAYGEAGAGADQPIHPGATLVYVVELLGIVDEEMYGLKFWEHEVRKLK